MFSFCIITRNEKKNIEQSILALLPYNQEIVVVDTGSSDGTVELLRKMSEQNLLIKFHCFEWCEDFSEAKNYAVEQASNEYVCIIDSDEFIESIDIEGIKKLNSENPDSVGRINRRNVFSRNGTQQENVEWINRFFSKKYYHYEGRIHEQVTRLDHESYSTYRIPLRIKHIGYDLSKEEREKKARRNIALLDIELASLLEKAKCNDVEELNGFKPEPNTPQEKIPYVFYQLGKSYYMMGDYKSAADNFEKGLIFDLDSNLEYMSDMVETYGYSLINSGREKDALLFEAIYDDFSYSADFHFLMGLIYMRNASFDKATNEFVEATKFDEAKMVGVNSYSAFYNIGVIKECLGMIDEAKNWYKKCEKYEPAYERLKELL